MFYGKVHDDFSLPKFQAVIQLENQEGRSWEVSETQLSLGMTETFPNVPSAFVLLLHKTIQNSQITHPKPEARVAASYHLYYAV